MANLTNEPPDALYHGVNNCQEYWDGNSYCLVRCLGESIWSAHRRYECDGIGFLFYAPTPEAAASRLGVRLLRTKRFRRCGRGFTLVHQN